METLESLKNYLADRPTVAFLALSLLALWYMFRKYDKAQAAHLATLLEIAPLADKLCYVISKIKKGKKEICSSNDGGDQ